MLSHKTANQRLEVICHALFRPKRPAARRARGKALFRHPPGLRQGADQHPVRQRQLLCQPKGLCPEPSARRRLTWQMKTTLSRVVFILSTRMGLAFAQKNLRRGFANAVIISTMFKNWTCSIWYALAPGSVL